jgi:hypothetical protein
MFKRISFGNGEIFDITVTDESGMKVGKWKVMKRDLPNTMRIINDKFGLNLSIKNRAEMKENNQDLDWAL